MDLRSLAAWRIGLGIYMILDVLSRWEEIDIWYSDDGLCTRQYMLNQHYLKSERIVICEREREIRLYHRTVMSFKFADTFNMPMLPVYLGIRFIYSKDGLLNTQYFWHSNAPISLYMVRACLRTLYHGRPSPSFWKGPEFMLRMHTV